MSPKKIGRYQVIRQLGTGGMASVFQAHDPRFHREVAIKLLPREYLHSRQLKARFQRESQTIASLEHHAIVPVHDTGTHDNQPYLVMRYMGGGSLAARLERGPLSVLDAANLLFRIGSALDFAHSRGVVHRDLKPANVLFDRFGESFLSDFGIAMLEEASLSITKTGSVIGTPAYMSPEQVQGDGKVDFSSDIYSLGIILFEMLTGKQPYQADTPTKLMMKHVLDPVPRIRDFDPRLPEGADEVVGRAMAKDRQARFATAGELAEATRALFGAERRGTGRPAMSVMARPPARRQVFKTLLSGGFSRPMFKTLLPESLIGPGLRRLDELPLRGRAAVGLVALALTLGLAAGLGYAWGLNPVQWVNGEPQQLRADLQEDYLRMAIDSYSVNRDPDLALRRYSALGESAEFTLDAVAVDPQELSRTAIQGFRALIEIEQEPGATPQPGEAEEPSNPLRSLTRLVLPVWGGTMFLGLMLVTVLVLRSRRQENSAAPNPPADTEEVEAGPAVQPFASQPELAGDDSLATFRTIYNLGENEYDDSFSLESPTGDFLGECGVGIGDLIGVGDPNKVSAFEVSLFDKNDIQTVTKVLMSNYSYHDDETRTRLSAKGDLVVAEPGGVISLQTPSLEMEARIVDIIYGESALPSQSFFERLTIELRVWSRDGAGKRIGKI